MLSQTRRRPRARAKISILATTVRSNGPTWWPATKAFGSAPSSAPARTCAPSMSIPPPQSSRPKFPPRWIGSRRGCCRERADEPPPVHPQDETQLVAWPPPLRRLHGARADQLVRRPLLRPAGGGALAPSRGPRGVGRLLGRVVQPAGRAVPTGLSGVCRLSQRDLVRPYPEGHAAGGARRARPGQGDRRHALRRLGGGIAHRADRSRHLNHGPIE